VLLVRAHSSFCVYFYEIGRIVTSFLNLRKLPCGRLAGVDCVPGHWAGCSRCVDWGSQGSAESTPAGQLKLK